MIPKISNGETFGGIANYANDIKDKNTTVLASNGVDLRNNYTIAQSFKVQAKMNPGLKTCVGHFSLAFSPEDAHRCTDAFMRKMAMEYMKKMGISDTQYVIFVTMTMIMCMWFTIVSTILAIPYLTDVM